MNPHDNDGAGGAHLCSERFRKKKKISKNIFLAMVLKLYFVLLFFAGKSSFTRSLYCFTFMSPRKKKNMIPIFSICHMVVTKPKKA